jgi:serine/threonine-protein kinase
VNERYRLVRSLATGGMAELFLGVARTEGFERTVAIKRMLPQLAQEPDIARMFLAEARLAMLLQHQNIATVYDVGQGPGGLFLVMELVDGWDLGVLLRTATRQGTRFPPHLAAFVTLQALAGLAHAYRKQHDGRPVMVAHRDVTPSNVLVSREGEVKVTDFGIARVAGGSFTEPGVFRGKEAYSAPEVLRGAPANAWSDQFSLGVVFHELLTGLHPFHHTKEPVAVAYAIMSREVAPLPPDVPAPLAAIALRMLARAPEGRFPTPEALTEALARWLAQSGEPATSHALADFLRTLRLPPTLRELGEAGGDARPASGPVTRPSQPQAFSLEEAEDASPHAPAGPALSASGRLVHRCTRCGSPLASPHAPCDRCAEELSPPSPTFTPATPARVSAAGTSPGSAPRAQLPPAHAPATSAARVPPASAWESAPTFTRPGGASPKAPLEAPVRSVLDLPAESLELTERAARPESDWQEAPGASGRRWKRAGVALGVVVLLAGGGAWLWAERALLTGHLVKLGVLPAPMLSVETEPSGATVWVEGQQVGTTPLAVDNLYPDKPLSIQVRLKGHRTWQGTFRGGEPVRFKVRLER